MSANTSTTIVAQVPTSQNTEYTETMQAVQATIQGGDFSADQVAFVTGAAGGIGLGIARQLILDGIKQIAVVDLNADALAAEYTDLEDVAKILRITCDCSNEEQIDAAVEKTAQEFGRLDVCVNAAGIAESNGRGKTADKAASNMAKIIQVNLMGVWLCQRAQIRQMLKQDMRDVATGLPLKTRGSIINLGSVASHKSVRGETPYCMSKHGVLGLCKADALDYAADGIRINCLCPGWVKTPMTQPLWSGPHGKLVCAKSPMQRWGLPEEIGYMASFLSSDKASFVTGTSISVDGGVGAM